MTLKFEGREQTAFSEHVCDVYVCTSVNRNDLHTQRTWENVLPSSELIISTNIFNFGTTLTLGHIPMVGFVDYVCIMHMHTWSRLAPHEVGWHLS